MSKIDVEKLRALLIVYHDAEFRYAEDATGSRQQALEMATHRLGDSLIDNAPALLDAAEERDKLRAEVERYRALIGRAEDGWMVFYDDGARGRLCTKGAAMVTSEEDAEDFPNTVRRVLLIAADEAEIDAALTGARPGAGGE